MFRTTETKVDKGKQKLFTHRLSAFANAVKKFDYILITSLIRSFPYADLWEYLSPQVYFFCKKNLTNDCFYGKIGGATLVILRRVCDLSTPKIKKIAQFFNKFFVQFSQKYTILALHRIKVLKFRISARKPFYMAPAAGCLTLICDLRVVV